METIGMARDNLPMFVCAYVSRLYRLTTQCPKWNSNTHTRFLLFTVCKEVLCRAGLGARLQRKTADKAQRPSLGKQACLARSGSFVESRATTSKHPYQTQSKQVWKESSAPASHLSGQPGFQCARHQQIQVMQAGTSLQDMLSSTVLSHGVQGTGEGRTGPSQKLPQAQKSHRLRF